MRSAPSTSNDGAQPRWLTAKSSMASASRKAASRRTPRKQGKLTWRDCPIDGSKQPMLGTPPADFLYATLSADKPVELTIELSRHERFGGFAYRPSRSGAGVRPADALVWVNGRQVQLCDRLAGYDRVPVAKRRGWHDAVLIDVPLERGENRLLVALGKGSQRAWFNAVRLAPNPVPALWSMIENDFPRSDNRLLDSVPYRLVRCGRRLVRRRRHAAIGAAIPGDSGGRVGARRRGCRPPPR